VNCHVEHERAVHLVSEAPEVRAEEKVDVQDAEPAQFADQVAVSVDPSVVTPLLITMYSLPAFSEAATISGCLQLCAIGFSPITG